LGIFQFLGGVSELLSCSLELSVHVLEACIVRYSEKSEA